MNNISRFSRLMHRLAAAAPYLPTRSELLTHITWLTQDGNVEVTRYDYENSILAGAVEVVGNPGQHVIYIRLPLYPPGLPWFTQRQVLVEQWKDSDDEFLTLEPMAVHKSILNYRPVIILEIHPLAVSAPTFVYRYELMLYAFGRPFIATPVTEE